jgi:alpha-glucosidase
MVFKVKTKIILCLLLMALAFDGFSQVKSIGRIVSWKKIPGGIEGKTPAAIFAVHAYSGSIIRVRVSKEKNLNSFSYALESNEIPDFKDIQVTENGKTIEISTSEMVVEIEKEPTFRVIFKNKKGEIINEDVPGEGFGTTFIGDKVTVYKKLMDGERFVGLGEVLGNLDKRGMGFTLNNTDTWKYGDPRLSMYVSVPFFIGIHSRQIYGIFFNNTWKTFFNFGLSTPDFSSITAEGGDADYFFFYDDSVGKIIEHYTSVTGRMPLPPLWSLGYHQSRCSYYPQENVKILAETFRRKKIPVDCIVLDADYLHEYEPFRVNKNRFPDLAGLAADLKKMNIEITASVNPGIKIDNTYEAYTDGLEKDVFVKYSNGSLFVSDIAPNTNHFPDFTNSKAREWWIEKMKFLPENGIHGYWNDMNEPAVGGSYLPDNLVFDFDGRKAIAPEAKNVFGMQMARSSFESALKYGNGSRPFILTRSGFAGVQRYSTVWTGDNTASDEFLLGGVLLNSQMGISGIPFVGPDIGGYIGDGTKELFTRWMEVGVFSPFMRNHKGFFTTANEPWAYGEEAEAISKTWLGFRYRLMPYIYSTFYETTLTGMPVARSLCIDYPFESKVYDNLFQHQFLFGDALLVVPVTSQEKVKKIWLPEGDWYNNFTDEILSGEKEWLQEVPVYQIPVFAKSSAIIPMQSLVQSTKDKPSDTLIIHIFNGNEKNSFVYYEDDGNSFDYQKGSFCKRNIEFDPAQNQVILGKQEGDFVSVFRKIKIILHGFGEKFTTVEIGGKSANLENCSIKILDGLENLADFYDKNYFRQLREAEPVLKQKMIVSDFISDEIKIQLK